MAFNFNIFSSGGGNPGVNGFSKYASAGALPGSANDGDIAITLDTTDLYAYDTGTPGWLIIGGPGVAFSVTDTNSVDLTLASDTLQADLRISGITGLGTGVQGISHVVYAGASPGLIGFVQGGLVREVTSSVLQFTGGSYVAMGSSLGIQVNQASGSTPGYLGTADYTRFATGVSALLNTQFPIFGGGRVDTGLTLWIPVADGSTGGYLTNNDWTTFNGKLSVGATIAQLGNIAATSILGNVAGSPAGITTLSYTAVKSALGISNNNFGDVTIGSFSYVSFAQGLTISAGQVLQAGWGDTSNPGMVGTTHQVWAGDKRTTGNFGAKAFDFYGGSLITIGSSAISGYNLWLPLSAGSVGTVLRNNDGTPGTLVWSLADPGRMVTLSGATTLNQVDRYIDLTAGTSGFIVSLSATGTTGLVHEMIKVDSGLGTITVQGTNGNAINGTTNFSFSTQWEAHKFVFGGTTMGWRVYS